MQFQFIDHADINDEKARKQIRSRVMIGKNVGKTRQRRDQAPTRERILLPMDVGAKRDLANRRHSDRKPEIPPSVGNDLSSLVYPQPLDAYNQRLLHQFFQTSQNILYPKELCILVKDIHVIWFEYFQMNEAYYHSMLAMAESQGDWLAGLQDDSPRTLRHLANTYRSINHNLQSEEVPSDATLAAVMSIAMHSNLLRASGIARIHVDALQRMVELRGGLEASRIHPILLQKICRTDIEYSLQSGARPRFYRDKFPYTIARSMPNWAASSQEVLEVLARSNIETPDVQGVFQDLVCASFFLNGEDSHTKIDAFSFQEILISIFYRLLHCYPLGERMPANDAEEACYLALLASLSTMFVRFEHSKISYQLLTDKLRVAILGLAGSTSTDASTLLWLLFVGRVSVFSLSDDTWLLPQIKKCLFALNVNSWQETRAQLTKFPWIRYFHDKSGYEVWNSLDLQ
ncbi:hypothetical protein ABW19_dt0208379 [Dactylella cylindrospora]|nr:hypothetical protein ABW19_dt0208379 [Dactylella cylindrospora]